jgi:hypothetical protein
MHVIIISVEETVLNELNVAVIAGSGLGDTEY